jgi:glutamine cyclotransferase
VFETDRIVRIDPASGRVVGTIYLGGLLAKADAAGATPDVLNGIAWDAVSDRIFVTGKLWPRLYEIRLKAPAT